MFDKCALLLGIQWPLQQLRTASETHVASLGHAARLELLAKAELPNFFPQRYTLRSFVVRAHYLCGFAALHVSLHPLHCSDYSQRKTSRICRSLGLSDFRLAIVPFARSILSQLLHRVPGSSKTLVRAFWLSQAVASRHNLSCKAAATFSGEVH